jgi:hypothetical protein
LTEKQNLSQGLIGENVLVLGFPIHRRPEAYPRLELSFSNLLHLLQAGKATILEEKVLLKDEKEL